MKKHQSAFILVFVIYIIVGIAAILLFRQNGSHLSHQSEANASIEKEASSQSASTQDTDPLSDDIAVVGGVETPDTAANEVESAPETNEMVVTETEPIETDEAAVPEPEHTDEAVSKEPVEPDLTADHSDDASSETDTTDELSEADDTDGQSETDATDELPETDTADTEPEKIYYGYTVKSGKTNVRVRKSTDRDSSIICLVNGDDTGYLIEKGKKRSKIVLADGAVGYIYNEYITVSEIPKKDVPKEYR